MLFNSLKTNNEIFITNYGINFTKIVNSVMNMGVKIAKNRISEFLDYLRKRYVLYAPIEKDGISKIGKIESVSEIAFLPYRTKISVKPIFFPPEEKFFKFQKKDGRFELEDYLLQIDEGEKVIFGLRGCDVRALEVLDRYMLSEFQDPYYRKRRENTLIIGLSCDYPRESCFCTAFGGMIPNRYDLWFTDIGSHYFVDIGSEKGRELVNSEFFEEATKEDEAKKIRKINTVEMEINRRTKIDLCEIKKCAQEIKKKANDPIWEELGKLCLSCGKCNFVCPTCHCFDMRDVTNIDGSEGERIRVWDSCHLYEYAKTSAENFRKERKARVRYRIYDKFVFPVMRYGVYACTGCGRCNEVCPAGINIRDVLRRLIS